MKFDLRFIFTLLVVLAIAAAVSPAVAVDSDLDDNGEANVAARGHRRDKCGQVCTGSNDCSGKCGRCVNFTCKKADLLDWVYGDPLDRLDEYEYDANELDDWDEMP